VHSLNRYCTFCELSVFFHPLNCAKLLILSGHTTDEHHVVYGC